jgi:hypothetical protein
VAWLKGHAIALSSTAGLSTCVNRALTMSDNHGFRGVGNRTVQRTYFFYSRIKVNCTCSIYAHESDLYIVGDNGVMQALMTSSFLDRRFLANLLTEFLLFGFTQMLFHIFFLTVDEKRSNGSIVALNSLLISPSNNKE